MIRAQRAVASAGSPVRVARVVGVGAQDKCSSSAQRAPHGDIACPTSQGAGQVLVKKGIFSDTYGTCRTCNGMRSIKCGNCKGTAQIKGACAACNGSRRNSSCSTCKATGRI